MWDISLGEERCRVPQWLNSIHQHAYNPYVILIGTNSEKVDFDVNAAFKQLKHKYKDQLKASAALSLVDQQKGLKRCKAKIQKMIARVISLPDNQVSQDHKLLWKALQRVGQSQPFLPLTRLFESLDVKGVTESDIRLAVKAAPVRLFEFFFFSTSSNCSPLGCVVLLLQIPRNGVLYFEPTVVSQCSLDSSEQIAPGKYPGF